MSEFLVFASKQAALDASRTEALRRGCGPVTTHWWSVVEHPDTKEGAIQLESEADKAGLSAGQKGAVQQEATLRTGGWFPVAVP